MLYRVTPVFDGEDLVARGVQIEAFSVEDEGEGLCFNVYIYNVQPGRHCDKVFIGSRGKSGQSFKGCVISYAGS